MRAQDLNPNIYYTRVYGGDTDIFMFPQKLYSSHFLRTTGSYPKYSRDYAVEDMEGIRLATPEEKHWLDVCIKKDTYVPRDIAMASFAKTVTVSTNPAYVRCTHSGNSRFKKGNVYKTYPGLNIRGNVYLQPEEDLGFKPGISDYPLDGGLWTFEPCEGPETSSTTAPEAKREVFGKFIIGNIVVSLRNNMPYREEGDMFTILPMSKQDILYYKPSTNSSDPGDWRLATTKECIAYHNGVKNIKQMNDPEEVPAQTKILTLQDIKADQYYYAEYSDKKGGSAVIKSTQNGSFKSAPGVRLDDDIYCPSNTWDCNKNIRLATADEITHLDCCRAHGTYMTKQRASELKIREVPSPSNAKKWAVRRTEANYKVLNAWANSQDDIASGHSSSGGWMHSINYGMSGHSRSGHYFADDTKHPDHTEISFEQFQREYLKSNPKINVEPVITKTMNPDKWCIEMDFDHPDKTEITDYMNKTYKAGMTGSGGFYYLENNRVKCNSAKPYGYDLMSINQFKSDIMKIVTNAPVQSVNVNSLPAQWHVLVDRDTIFDAQLWRWDGNRANYQLEIGQLVGVPEYGDKGHNPGRSPGIFGKQLSYSEFKKYVMTEAERTRLLLIKYPIGSCIVVTQERSNYNGKQNYCYKVCSIKATSDDPTVMYSSMNGIGIRTVGVRYATPEETTRYEREGQPYDVTILEKEIEVNNGIPKYVKFVDYGANMKGIIVCTDHPVPAKLGVTMSWKEIKDHGRFTDGSIVAVRKEEYDAYILKSEESVVTTTDDYSNKSLTEVCAMCNQMFPVGSVVNFSSNGSDLFTVEKEFSIGSNSYISYAGFPIVYRYSEKNLRCKLVSLPKTETAPRWTTTKQPDKSASKEEILEYCKAMYPKGTVVQYGGSTGVITQEVKWESNVFISHPGAPIVYNRGNHEFASVVSYVQTHSTPTKTLKDLPKKATLSDVSALVKHQEPVIAFSKKAKRSKLVIINK